MIVIETQNSIYEIDTDARLARRIIGQNDPTPKFAEDELWHPYANVSVPVVGDCLVVYWSDGKATITTPAQSVIAKS